VRTHLARAVKAAGHAVELADGPTHARRIGSRDLDLAVVAPKGLEAGGWDLLSELEARMPTLLWAPASNQNHSEKTAALLARIAEAIRPPEVPEPGPPLRFAGYILDIAAHSLTKQDGTEIPLTRGEFNLLLEFLQRPGRVLTRDQLLHALAGKAAEAFDRSVDMLVSRLRRKIEPNFKRPSLTITVPGTGYKFTGEVEKLGGDPDQKYFSVGLVDDLVTELSRNTSLLIISQRPSFSSCGQVRDLNRIARELGVRYVVEGSVRRAANRVRVNAKLIEAELGKHIWAERYDRALKDVFAVQDEITHAVVTAVQPAIADAEYWRTLRKPLESFGAWEAYQRGLWHKSKLNNPNDILQARQFFERATELDPAFAMPHSQLADLIVQEVVYFASRPLPDLKLAEVAAQMAVELDSRDASALTILARSLASAGTFSLAFGHVDRALAINPNSVDALRMKGIMLVHNDHTAQGRELLARSVRMDPYNKSITDTHCFVGLSYFAECDYVTAAQYLYKALGHFPNHYWSLQWLAASLGQLGETLKARNALQKAAAISPGAFDRYTRQRPPNFHPRHFERMLDGLREAGWQG
jgi:TolB-like protein/Tfp pilus assembly protein PilF